ncbi:MAG: type 1 glutamine amidotransferase [Phycisphaerales bacterium]
MAIIVLQHQDSGHPGRLGRALREQAHRLDIRRLDKGDGVPVDLDNVSAVVSLGGRQNVGDNVAWLGREMEFIKAAHEAGLPVVGVCLGAQLVAAALGGQVGPMDKPEIGFHPVSLNPTGQVDPILAGVAWNAPQFCHHGQQVTELPPGATLLGSSQACRVQAFKCGRSTYAFQFHFEAERAQVEAICRADADMDQRAGVTAEQVLSQHDKHEDAFARAAERLSENIATFLIPSRTRVAV